MSAVGKKKAKPAGASARKKTKAKVTKAKVTKPKKVVKHAPVKEKPKKVAPKVKKAAEKKEAPPKLVAKTEPIKLGPPPVAMIALMHIDSSRERAARGFSFGELASAGVPLNAAKRQDLPLDIRRRSVMVRNVEMLKGWFKPSDRPSARVGAEKAVAAAHASKKK
jgi:ribosomal protein L13E